MAAASKPRRPPKASASWAWFFDVDGTLVEIATTPSSVIVNDDLRRLISRLTTKSGGALSLITGRAAADVDDMIAVSGVSIAGQHGVEIRSPGEADTDIVSITGNLDRIVEELEQLALRHRGLIVEHKGRSVALHYRRAPALAGYAHRFVRALHSRYGKGLVLQKGKRVVELKPESANKGEAIRVLMQRPPFRGRMPVFVGDDITDEAGFEAVNELGGISVKVGRGPTLARYRMSGVDDVRRWIAEAVDERRDSSRNNGAA